MTINLIYLRLFQIYINFSQNASIFQNNTLYRVLPTVTSAGCLCNCKNSLSMPIHKEEIKNYFFAKKLNESLFLILFI